MNNNEDFKITIERIKEIKGSESQEKFAEKIHMTQSNVSKLLNGTPPSASTLIAISKEYDVSVDWLLGLTDRKSSKNFPDTNEITYADVLAVFDVLIENNSLMTNCMGDSSMFHIFDEALNYLLSSRITVKELDVDTRKYWYKTTAEQFADYKILKWKPNYNKVFENCMPNKPEKPENSDVIDFINLVNTKKGNKHFE